MDQARQEVVLFSKLNTLKFPHPGEIISYLKRVLEPARMLDFQVHVRKIPEGTPYLGSVASVDISKYVVENIDDEGEPRMIRSTTDRKGVVDLRLPFGKDFTVAATGCTSPPTLHVLVHIQHAHVYTSTCLLAVFAFAVCTPI